MPYYKGVTFSLANLVNANTNRGWWLKQHQQRPVFHVSTLMMEPVLPTGSSMCVNGVDQGPG